MPKKTAPPGDGFKIRCPRLGHQIYFSYCRAENQGLPCMKTLDCWHTQFEVEAYLKAALSEAEWQKAFLTHAKPKMLSLLELIELAKKNTREAK